MSVATRNLEAVLASTPHLWKGRQVGRPSATIPTGHVQLDNRLPGGGWPRGAVTELIAARPGLGEFSLLFPALAEAGEEGRWLLLVDPPWVPYPAALHGHGLCLERLLLVRTTNRDESLWACEQALRDMPGGIVLTWPEEIRFTALRRLQLAAEGRGGTAFLFRPERAAAEASPTALRLKLGSEGDAVRIEVLKCRGHRPAKPLLLQKPQCGHQGRHERIPVAQNDLAGDTAAAIGAGLPYPRPSPKGRSRRHH